MGIFNNQSLPKNLVNIINDVMPKIHKLIIDTPTNCPEPRMWARKEELWNKIKNLNLSYNFTCLSSKVEFFPDNEPQIFIEATENFYNSVLWRKILHWNEKSKVLKGSQLGMIKCVIKNVTTKDPLSKKQISYAKDLFMAAVKAGFEYKE